MTCGQTAIVLLPLVRHWCRTFNILLVFAQLPRRNARQFLSCYQWSNSMSFGVFLWHATLLPDVQYSVFLSIVKTERPPFVFELLFALVKFMEFWCISEACEIALARSIAYLFGQLLRRNTRLFFLCFCFCSHVSISLCLCISCCMRHFNDGCSCSAVGIRGLLEVDLCGETSCFLKLHMSARNVSRNACHYRSNSFMSLRCEK